MTNISQLLRVVDDALRALSTLMGQNKLGMVYARAGAKQDKHKVWDPLYTVLAELYTVGKEIDARIADATNALAAMQRFGIGVPEDLLVELTNALRLISLEAGAYPGRVYDVRGYNAAIAIARRVLAAQEEAKQRKIDARRHLELVSSTFESQAVWHRAVSANMHKFKKSLSIPRRQRKPQVDAAVVPPLNLKDVAVRLEDIDMGTITVGHQVLLDARNKLQPDMPAYRKTAEMMALRTLSEGPRIPHLRLELPPEIMKQIQDYAQTKVTQALAKMEAAGNAEVERRKEARKAAAEQEAKTSVSSKLNQLMRDASPQERALLEKLYKNL